MIETKQLILPLIGAALLTPALSWAGPLPPVNDEQDLAERDLARPVVVYNRSTTAPCFADYVPSAAEVKAPFAVRMARNEFESVQVALYVPRSAQPLRDVRIRVHCEIPSTVGHIYYQPKEELEWIGELETERGKPWEGKRSVLPQVVIPLNRIKAIQPGRTGAFWLNFRTAGNVTPGDYEGTIEVHAAESLLDTVPFNIRVHPFVLPRPATLYGLYYYPYRTDPKFQGRDFARLYLADMAAHGMNTMFTTVAKTALADADYDETSSTPHQEAWYSLSSRRYCDNYFGPDDYEPEGGYNAIKFIDAQIAMGRAAGLIQLDQPLISQPEDYTLQNKATVAAALKRYSAERGWADFILFMRDEPGPDVFARVIEHVSEWKRLEMKTTCAMSMLAAFGVGHVHDLWIVLAGTITPQLQLEAARLGAKVATYNFALRTTNAEAGRYYSGLYTWSLGLAGNVTYNYMWLPSYGPGLRKQAYFDDQWKLSKPSNLGHVLPSPVGPVPGVGFEGRREGVDDARYLQLLEARIAAAPDDDPTASAGRCWLDRLRRDAFSHTFLPTQSFAWDWIDPHSNLAPDDYDAIRARAADFILQLPPAEGETNPPPVQVRRTDSFVLESTAFEGSTIDECLNALRDGTIKQQRQAAAALALREASQAQPARSVLIELLDRPEVRPVALRALAQLGPEAEPAIRKLRELLEHDDAFIRVGATYVLSTIGPAATDVLIECKQDPNFTIANLAVETLERWEKEGRQSEQ